jgi:hypothetical protein
MMTIEINRHPRWGWLSATAGPLPITDEQLAAMIDQFEARGMRTPAPGQRPGWSIAIAERLGLFPAQVYATLGHWRNGLYDLTPRPAAAAQPEAAAAQRDVTVKLSAEEAQQMLAVAALLKRRLHQ